MLSGDKGERKQVEHVALSPEELHEIITRQNSFFFLLSSFFFFPLLLCHLATVSSCYHVILQDINLLQFLFLVSFSLLFFWFSFMFFIPFVLFFTSSQLTLNMVNDKLRHMPEHQRSEGEALLTVISLVYVSLWPTLSDKHSLFVYHQKTNPTQPNPNKQTTYLAPICWIQVVSKRKMHFCMLDFEKRKICPRCWTKKFKCICDRVVQTSVRHNILLYMHYRGQSISQSVTLSLSLVL